MRSPHLSVFRSIAEGRLYHGISRFWSRSLLRVCGVRVRVRGAEHIDRSRPTVYVSNHASMLDIPVVVAGIADDVRLVYKKELERIPLFGWGLKWGSYIGIDRGRGNKAVRSLEEAVAKIRGGTSVLLFAEGTRTSDGKLQPFKRGAFNLATRAGVPVIPLTINGSYGIVPKHSMRIRPGTVELVLDPPIRLEGMHRPGRRAPPDGTGPRRHRKELHRPVRSHPWLCP